MSSQSTDPFPEKIGKGKVSRPKRAVASLLRAWDFFIYQEELATEGPEDTETHEGDRRNRG